MSNYYCLVASLPEIAFDGNKALYSVDKFRDEVYPFLSSEDRRIVNLIFHERDNANILRLLRYGSDANLESLGCYDKGQLLDIITAAKECETRANDVPAYLYDFLEQYFAEEERTDLLWEDVLATYYYNYSISCANKFVSEWFVFNLNVNNILAATIARKYKLNVADYVLGDNEISNALRTSTSRDFGLGGMLDYSDAVLRISENEKLQEREHLLDELRWAWLDENSVFNYFTVEKLITLLIKLRIVERWAILDTDKGMQRYNELVEGLKGDMNIVPE